MSQKLFTDIQDTIIYRNKQYIVSIIKPIFEQEYLHFKTAPLTIVQKMPDSVVINGIKNLDEKILRYLYRYHLKKIKGMVINKGGTEEDANDVFQDTMVDITEQVKRGKFNINKSIDGFIIKVSINKWSRKLKNDIKIRHVEVSINESDIDKYPTEIEEDNSNNLPDNFDKISDWLDKLSDSCKRLVEEFYYYGNDWKLIAKKFGYKSAASAKNQKYKCMEKLKVAIEAGKYNMWFIKSQY